MINVVCPFFAQIGFAGPQEDPFSNTWAGENDLRREDVSQFGKDTLFQWVLHTLKLILCDVMLDLMVKLLDQWLPAVHKD